MKKVKGGFAFPALVTPCELGIKEEFKVVLNNGVLKVNLLCGVGVDRIPVKPATIRQDDFISVTELVNTAEEPVAGLSTFMRSNKPTYSLLGVSVLFAKVDGFFDVAEDKWTDNTEVLLYTPRTVGKSGNDNFLVCSQLGTQRGVDTAVVSQQTYDSFKESILNYLATCISDRELFIGTRAEVFA